MNKLMISTLALAVFTITFMICANFTSVNDDLLGTSSAVQLNVENQSQSLAIYAGTPAVAASAAATISATAAAANAAVNVARYFRTQRGASYEITDEKVLMHNLD